MVLIVLIVWPCLMLKKARKNDKRKAAFGKKRISDAIVGRF